MRLRAAYSYFRRNSNASIDALGATSDQFVLLTVLADHGPATQQELVRECHSDTTTVGTMVALMESRGWVRRGRHARDARAWTVALTPTGKRLQRELWEASAGVRRRLETLFQPPELAVLSGYLDRVIEAMRPSPRRISPAAAVVDGGSPPRSARRTTGRRTVGSRRSPD